MPGVLFPYQIGTPEMDKPKPTTRKLPDDRGISGKHAYGHSGGAEEKPYAAPSGTTERQQAKRDSLTTGRSKRGKAHIPST